VTGIADELAGLYVGLGEKWSGEDNKERFVDMMLTDGCFLLEVMRMRGCFSLDVMRMRAREMGLQDYDSESEMGLQDYDSNDPIFGEYGYHDGWPIVYRDIILLENQLPLLLLQKIRAVMDPSPSVRIYYLLCPFINLII
jgi:hypothetical protein